MLTCAAYLMTSSHLGEDPHCSASVPKGAIRILDHEQYMGVIFSNPCGGPSQSEAAMWLVRFGASFSFLCFLVFAVRCYQQHRGGGGSGGGGGGGSGGVVTGYGVNSD